MKTIRSIIYLAFVLIVVAFFALLPKAQAVVPPPDGGYPGFTTAEGQKALFSLTTGSANTAVGWSSLSSNAEGSFNTATGAGALLFNTADENTALGAAALLFNTTGGGNTATGAAALINNTTGHYNTATGDRTLDSNMTSDANTGVGFEALHLNTSGYSNTATGAGALQRNTEGYTNTATGINALNSNDTGASNTAIGAAAMFGNTSGDHNIALGDLAGIALTTGSNNICIGSEVLGVAGENNTIRIADNLPNNDPSVSACYIGGIYGSSYDASTATLVYIDVNKKMGTTPSSRRFKRDIQPMDKISETILALKPVSFHYKSDAKNTPCFGLIAEDVAAINPNLVLRDQEGEVYSVRYEQINAMLLNEFLKEHRTVQQLKSMVAKQDANAAKQEATIARQQKQIDALTVGLQKVSAQLEASTSAPQVVNNP